MPEKLQGRLGPPDQTLYLVDISSFIFRAYFAIRSLKNRAGEPTNAVYGVATMLARLAEEANPQYLAVLYDSKEPSFRKEIYQEYKANRSAPPDDLVPQFARIEQLIRCMGIHSYRWPGVEADDLIASLARHWLKESPKHRVVVVTGDKDLMQLVDDRVLVWDTMNNAVYDEKGVADKYGVRPTQIRDFLGLVGDSSDNIPGVPGVGPKTAVTLLQEHGDLDHVLKAAKAGKIPGKRGEVLAAHENDARLSAELATLHTELPMKMSVSELRYAFSMSDACADLLRELDFHSLVSKWAPYREGSARGDGGPVPEAREEPKVAPSITAPEVGENTFRTVSTEKDLQKLLAALDRSPEFGFDLETTSLNPRQAELVGIAICHDPSFGLYIPVGHKGTPVAQLPKGMVLERLKPYLESAKHKKIGQNLKYDWSVLYEHGIRPQGIGADTMVAAYVLEPEGRHNLDTLAAHYLNYNVMTYEQVCAEAAEKAGIKPKEVCFDQVSVEAAARYSAEDAWVAMKLWRALQPKLEEERLMEVFAEVDLPMVDVLCRMELQGVCIDESWLHKLSAEFEKDLKRIEDRVEAFTKGPINLNSTKQLGHLLFEELKLPVQGKTKTGYSTDAKVLDALAPLHEVPRLLLEYREISKLKGTYVDPLPGLKDPKTGKIHTSFHQTVAATGRLSSTDPNLQNIPIRTERGRKIRRAFIPSEGNCLVSADYSQIELRLLAHMSGDKELVGSFQRDEDVHRRTASEIFAVAPEQVTDRQRGIAKAINFGLMYGKTAFGLAQELKIPRREAQDVIDRYFQRYNGVKRFLDQQIIEAKEKGYAMTLLGRKRHLPDIHSRNPAVRAIAERMAMNTPIQGTAADLMKLAMIELDQALTKGGYRSKLTLQVHDEVLLDAPREEAKEVEELVTGVMEAAMKLSVPLRVNSSVGDNWMDL